MTVYNTSNLCVYGPLVYLSLSNIIFDYTCSSIKHREIHFAIVVMYENCFLLQRHIFEEVINVIYIHNLWLF